MNEMETPNSKFVSDPNMESIQEILKRYKVFKIDELFKSDDTIERTIYKCVKFGAEKK